MDEILNIREAAGYLKLNQMTIYKLVQKGQLPAFKVGGNWRFQKDILDNWMREKITENTAPALRISTLVVDDDPMVRDILTEMIRDQNCAVIAVADGEQALERVGLQHFDLIFLDLKLPGQNGLEVLKTIKEQDKGAIVVIVTGFAEEDIALEAVNYGPLTMIRKPFRESDIVEVLDLVISRKRA